MKKLSALITSALIGSLLFAPLSHAGSYFNIAIVEEIAGRCGQVTNSTDRTRCKIQARQGVRHYLRETRKNESVHNSATEEKRRLLRQRVDGAMQQRLRDQLRQVPNPFLHSDNTGEGLAREAHIRYSDPKSLSRPTGSMTNEKKRFLRDLGSAARFRGLFSEPRKGTWGYRRSQLRGAGRSLGEHPLQIRGDN